MRHDNANFHPAPWWLLLALMLSSCSSAPPPADWKLNAVSLLDHAQQRWLEGDSKSAELALTKARAEIARSGRIDLLARAELSACASKIASLDFSTCAAFDQLASDASTSDRAYARFLATDWTDLNARSLPVHYADLVGAKDAAQANRAAIEIKPPLPKLIAIALLFRAGRADPAALSAAVETASEQGWRRPLLGWLEVQLQRAKAGSDINAAAQLQRRIDFVLSTNPTP